MVLEININIMNKKRNYLMILLHFWTKYYFYILYNILIIILNENKCELKLYKI